MTIPTKNNFEMNASGPNELKVSYICIGNTQFSQYFDTMMSLCCLICTDEITKCIYKTPKITPPPPSTLLMTSIGSVDFISIEWWGHFFLHFLFFPPPHPRPPLLIPSSPFLPVFPFPIWALPPPPFLKSPLPITFSPFLLPYMPKICSIASKKKLFMKIQIFHILPGDLTVRSESYFLCGCLYATPI